MKVFFITGNRSEYGLLKRLIKLVTNIDFIDTFLFVTGDHLNNETNTITEIENDNLKINGTHITFSFKNQDALGSKINVEVR